MTKNNKNKRWLWFTVTGAASATVLGIALLFLLTYRSRAEAARYLGTVSRVPIGTSYDDVVIRLRNAQVAMALPRDCHQECILLFDVDDKWLYMLHLAQPAEFAGRLDFQNGKLVYKSTSMGRGLCCAAVVLESGSKSSKISRGNTDASGHPWKVLVEVSALDFTEYRTQAYAFNLGCIGSLKGCRTDEYLPMVNKLEDTTSK